MSMTDDNFRKAFKPLHIPAHYPDAVNNQDKVVYALAQLGEGTADTVTKKLLESDAALNTEGLSEMVTTMLKDLYRLGLIRGLERYGQMHYDLSKITQANEGGIDPHLLSPGLD
jgi:hypothetical protein